MLTGFWGVLRIIGFYRRESRSFLACEVKVHDPDIASAIPFVKSPAGSCRALPRSRCSGKVPLTRLEPWHEPAPELVPWTLGGLLLG